MKTIGLVGGGNMGTAIISRIFKNYKITVCEKDVTRRTLLRKKFKAVARDLKGLVEVSDVVILAVKPQDMDGVTDEMKSYVRPSQVVVSIAAGITTAYFEKRLGDRVRVIRTMPNMPAQIGEGVTAVCPGAYAKPADVKLACAIFNRIGKTVVVKESMIDAITAVSGSGPAYVFLFVECFKKAAESLGLDAKLSDALVTATLTGSAHLLVRQADDAATLRSKVTSKGGTTQAAMDVFMKYDISKIFQEALAAAEKRAKELARTI